MSGTRLQNKSTPITNRLPQWSYTNYYEEGNLVWSKVFDSESFELYICVRNHYSGDSDGSLVIHDSDSLTPDLLNEKNWRLFVKEGPFDSDSRSLAAINWKTRNYRQTIDSDIKISTAQINWLLSTVPFLPDSDSVDSDIKIANEKIIEINSKTITDMVDSDSVHNGLIVWDSDSAAYTTKLFIYTFNGIGPDENGDIPLSLVKVISGTKDDKPDSELNGSVFIVSGDSESSSNGTSYVFDNGSWVSFISPDRKRYDKKFLRSNGDNSLVGSLYVPDPIQDTQIVNKKYVDDFVKDNKQDQFNLFDSEGAVDLSLIDSENFYVIKSRPTLHFYDKINNNIIGESIDDLTNFKDVSVVSPNVLNITTNYFSSIVYGNLQVKRNGVLEAFTIDSSSNLDYNAIVANVAQDSKLKDQFNQSFTLNLSSPYNVSDSYEISYTWTTSDTAKINKAAGSNDWIVAGNNYDFGTY